VHRVIKGERYDKQIEFRTVYKEGEKIAITGKDKEARERIVKRATAEI
jgi:hypothetical protein